MKAFGCFDSPELFRRTAAPLRFEFTLYVRQCLRLDQQTLSFVAAVAGQQPARARGSPARSGVRVSSPKVFAKPNGCGIALQSQDFRFG
jgi:hypothetical protein